jgi:hypothetical protein
MVRQGDQEGARLLSNAIRPGNSRIRAPNQVIATACMSVIVFMMIAFI